MTQRKRAKPAKGGQRSVPAARTAPQPTAATQARPPAYDPTMRDSGGGGGGY